MNGTTANEHALEIENLIHTIKEIQIAKINTLPFKRSKFTKLFKDQSTIQSVL